MQVELLEHVGVAEHAALGAAIDDAMAGVVVMPDSAVDDVILLEQLAYQEPGPRSMMMLSGIDVSSPSVVDITSPRPPAAGS